MLLFLSMINDVRREGGGHVTVVMCQTSDQQHNCSSILTTPVQVIIHSMLSVISVKCFLKNHISYSSSVKIWTTIISHLSFSLLSPWLTFGKSWRVITDKWLQSYGCWQCDRVTDGDSATELWVVSVRRRVMTKTPDDWYVLQAINQRSAQSSQSPPW